MNTSTLVQQTVLRIRVPRASRQQRPVLQDGQRVDDTPLHEALREALANMLMHADYSGRVSVLVVKRPDLFGFRNPGRMRIPLELARVGGHSDCRNRRLQTMFQLVGYGDHAGSGLPKIYKNWAIQHWRSPLLYELTDPEQTVMELRMSSLVPERALEILTAKLGARFSRSPEAARLALITAQVEGVVSHDRLKQISTEHPADLTKQLGRLVRDNLLISQGAGRGMVYVLPWQTHSPAAAFDESEPPELEGKPPELGGKPPELEGKPPELVLLLDWASLSPSEQKALAAIAAPVAEAAKVKRELLQKVIWALCAQRYLGGRVLAHVLNRDPDDLRKRTLTPMVRAGLLRAAFAANSDPRQAYTAATSENE